SGSRASVRFTSTSRISSSRARSDTMVGITSTSPCRASNLPTSRSTSPPAPPLPRQELAALALHERLGPLGFARALAQVRVHHLLEIVDVVAVDVVEPVPARLHVAGHGDVDGDQRA